MPGPSFSSRTLLYVALIVFILVKIPLLHYAFYWDESWVYAPAIFSMYGHGASIMPNAIPPELSRGHPLVFHAIYALWMNVAGPTNFSMHLLSLTLSVGLALLVFYVLAKRFDDETALLAVLVLLASHEFFMASTFVLNDILLGGLALLAIHLYAAGRYGSASIALILLVLTKESGIAIWLAICGIEVWRNRRHPQLLKTAWPIAALPAAAFLAFLLLQKHQMGWYLYPNHIDSIAPSIHNTLDKLQQSLRFIFSESGEWLLTILIGALSLKLYFVSRQKKHLAPAFLVAMLFANINLFSYKDAVFYAFPLFCIALAIRYTSRITATLSPKNSLFLQTALLCASVYLYFCCVNFFEKRYLFPSLLLFQVVLTPVVALWLINNLGIQKPLRFAFILLIPLFLTPYNRHFVEFDRMWVQSAVVKFMEQNSLYQAEICAPSFFERIHLADPKTGFRSTPENFNIISENISHSTDYVIVDNAETTSIQYPVSFDPNSYSLIFKAHKGETTALIYIRRHQAPASHDDQHF
jgi:4-amino-4-deoxy-L-arabinose transferase-like glycosyltransferase